MGEKKFAVYDQIEELSEVFTPDAVGTQIHACDRRVYFLRR